MLEVIADGGGADGEGIGHLAGGMPQGEQFEDALFLIGKGGKGSGAGGVFDGGGELVGGALDVHLVVDVAEEVEADEAVGEAKGEGGDVEPAEAGGGVGLEVEGGDGIAVEGLLEDGAGFGADFAGAGMGALEKVGAGGAGEGLGGGTEEELGGGVGVGDAAVAGDDEGGVGGGVEAIAEFAFKHVTGGGAIEGPGGGSEE